MKWKLGKFLKEHGISAYRLAQEIGLTRQGVSKIVNNKVEGLDFKTLAKVLESLEKLTGKRVEPNDVLEVVRNG